jgi:hypothetical protein
MIWQFRLINRDPNILPIKARTTLAVALVSIGTLMLYSNDIGVSRALAGVRIVLTGFGVLVTYWATAAKEQDLQCVANEIAKFSNTKLTFQDIRQVIVLHYMAIVMFFILCSSSSNSKIPPRPSYITRISMYRHIVLIFCQFGDWRVCSDQIDPLVVQPLAPKNSGFSRPEYRNQELLKAHWRRKRSPILVRATSGNFCLVPRKRDRLFIEQRLAPATTSIPPRKLNRTVLPR